MGQKLMGIARIGNALAGAHARSAARRPGAAALGLGGPLRARLVGAGTVC